MQEFFDFLNDFFKKLRAYGSIGSVQALGSTAIISQKRKEYRQKNKEKIREQNRIYYLRKKEKLEEQKQAELATNNDEAGNQY